MHRWSVTESYIFTTFSCSCVCALLIVFLLLRHKLLLSGRLTPEQFGFKDFFGALLNWIKRQKPVATTNATRNRDADVLFHKRIATYCTFGCCISFLLLCLGFLLINVSDDLDVLRWNVCHYAVAVNGIFYATAKNCMYSVLVSRLYLGFKNSAYGYSQRLIYAMYALIAVWQLTTTVLLTVSVYGEHEDVYKSTAKDSKVSGVAKRCMSHMPLWLGTMVVAFDVLFSVTVVYLFTSALKRMLANLMKTWDEMSKAKKSKAELFLLPVKYTLITVVAICSTLFAFVVFAVSGIVFLMAVDTVVNCGALLLMTSKWKPVYAVTFNPLLRCVVVTPCLGCADLSHLELVDSVKKLELAKVKNTSSVGTGTH